MANYALYAWVNQRGGRFFATVAALRHGHDRVSEQHEQAHATDREATATLGQLVRALMAAIKARGDRIATLSMLPPALSLRHSFGGDEHEEWRPEDESNVGTAP